MMKKPKIDFSCAQSIAIDRAKEVMEGFSPDSPVSILENFHLENEYCWLFFRNRNIVIPNQPKRIFADGAFAVGKTGKSLVVHDCFGDQKKLDDQMEKLSEYFRKAE